MQFSLYSKRRLRFCLLFGLIFLPLSLIVVCEVAIKINDAFLLYIGIEILYVIVILAPWWLYYVKKPQGIRYGHISAKNPVRAGKYSGYNYNIYFQDIHKSLLNIYISEIVPGHRYKQLRLKDPIKVVKCYSGLIITMR